MTLQLLCLTITDGLGYFKLFVHLPLWIHRVEFFWEIVHIVGTVYFVGFVTLRLRLLPSCQ